MEEQYHGQDPEVTDSNLPSDSDGLPHSQERLHEKGHEKDDDDALIDHMTTQRLLAIIALALSSTGSGIDSFFLGPSLVFIADDLNIGSERSWVSVAHSLASACTAPCAGYLQDWAGRKLSLAIGLFCTIVGQIIIATSNTFPQIVAGATLAGIGAAIQELTSVAVISELVPSKKRGLYLSLNSIFTLVFAPSVLYAQLLSSGSDWRWLFWISLIWNGCSTVALLLTFFPMKISRLSRHEDQFSWKQVDYAGIVFYVVGLTIFLVALQSGGTSDPWTSAYVLVQLIIGALLLVAFFFWEWKAPWGKKLVPFRIFQGQRVVGLSLLVGIFSSVTYHSVLNLGPEILEACFSFSPVGFGVIALGPSLALAVGAASSNILFTISKGRAREILTAGAVLMTAFTGAQAIINPYDATTFAILGSFASLGVGAILVPLQTTVVLACPQDLLGTVVALTSSIRTLGGTIGYTILYNVFLTRSATDVPAQMAPRLVEAGLPKADVQGFITQYLQAVAGGSGALPKASEAVLEAGRLGFQWGTSEAASIVYYATIPFSVVAIVCAIFLPDMRPYMTDQVLSRSKTKLKRNGTGDSVTVKPERV